MRFTVTSSGRPAEELPLPTTTRPTTEDREATRLAPSPEPSPSLSREVTERSKSAEAIRAAAVLRRRRRAGALQTGARITTLLGGFYVFFFSIELMSTAFKLLGGTLTAGLIHTASDPFTGLLMGLVVTACAQSSSFTTSLVVGLVATGAMPLRVAIPIVMGANVGTTVTNLIVSLGHVSRLGEFRRALAAAIVHDFFNVLTVTVLFPLELVLHPIERVATRFEEFFVGCGGLSLVSPLKVVVKPASEAVSRLVPHGLLLLAIALLALFFALMLMVRTMRRLVMTRVERLFDRVLFRNAAAAFLLGWILTSIVQSSSVTTSLVVPLAGTGMLTLRQVFPYALGANLGTTITAILASFATGVPAAVTVAFAHMLFNFGGILIFYPLRALPIGLAEAVASLASRSRRGAALVIGLLAIFFLGPILYVLRSYLFGG